MKVVYGTEKEPESRFTEEERWPVLNLETMKFEAAATRAEHAKMDRKMYRLLTEYPAIRVLVRK